MQRLIKALLAMLIVSCALLSAVPALAATEPAGTALQGTLRDAERQPVEGVLVTVLQDGEAIGQSTTDADGQWLVELPGRGLYSVMLDTSTLPEGVGLVNDGEDTLDEVEVDENQQRTVIFPLGEGGEGGEGGSAAPELARFSGRLAQVIVNGIRYGTIIAITAIGLSLVFGTTGLINFAHGELVTIGATLAFLFNVSSVGPQWQLIPAAILAICLVGLLGGGLELTLWRPLRRRGTGLIQLFIISVGLSLLLRHIVLVLFGGRPSSYADYALQQAIDVGPVSITPRDLVVAVLSLLVLVGVGLVLQRTRIGKAMRAVSDNRDLAESSGIDVQRVILFVWVFGGALAGLGGIFFGMTEVIAWDMGFRLLLLMFAGVILGGLGTAYGAMVGSLLVGLVAQLSTLYFPSALQNAWALGALILVLLLRPQGILGRAERVG